MKLIIEIDEVRFKDIQRIADAQLEMNHFQTAEQIISKGVPLEHEPILGKIRSEIMDFEEELFHRPNTDYADYAAVRHCVEIIDKYKAESEESK